MKDRLFQIIMLFFFIGIVAFSRLLASTQAYSDDVEVEPNHNINSSETVEREWGLPSLRITSELHPFEVDRLLWHEGFVSFSNEFEDIGVQLRGRGNSTWLHWEERRPFRLRFHEPRVMLESGYGHRDWIMLANSFDQTQMRNYFTFYLANLMGNTGFVPDSRFVHLYINDDYIGVYQLVDERDIGRGRLDLLIQTDPTRSEYLIEMDRRWGDDEAIDIMINDRRRPHDIRFPSGRQQTPDHIEYVCQYLYEITEAIQSHDWERIITVIDVPSFVEFYLVHEIVQSQDVAWASSFMQIRGQENDRRLYMGPLWDFDMTFGMRQNERACSSERRGTPEGIPWVASYKRHWWFRELIQIPEFKAEVLIRWNEIKDDELPRTIQEVERLVSTYQADFERSYLYQSFMQGSAEVYCIGDHEQLETYIEHVEFLFDFIDRRITWLDSYFNSAQF